MSAADDKMKKLVLDVLASGFIQKLDFGFDAIKVTPEFYGKVEDAISDGKVGVFIEPNLLPGKVAGRYYGKLPLPNGTTLYDFLVFRSPEIPDGAAALSLVPLIVHECTHAGFDIGQVKKMTSLAGEAAAYIAQAIVFDEMLAAAKIKRPTAPTALGKAMNAIADAPKKKNIEKKLMNDLYTAISAIDEYKGLDKVVLPNDGVGRAPTVAPAVGKSVSASPGR